jgi:ABC-type uncharacterized transport system fused permease/ATPase subunit
MPNLVYSIVRSSCKDSGGYLLAGVVLGSLLAEMVSAQVMTVLSDMYEAVSTVDLGLFYKALIFGLLLVTSISAIKAGVVYATESTALLWRNALTASIHSSPYFTTGLRAGSSTTLLEKLQPLDQRIAQDVDRLTTLAAQLVAEVFPLPVVIAYYSAFLVALFGWSVVAACLLYFLCGSAVSYILARRLVSVVYQQESLEGQFRSGHCSFQAHRAEIQLLRGERAEQAVLGSVYADLVVNTQQLLLRRLWLKAFSNWFAYAGSICKDR